MSTQRFDSRIQLSQDILAKISQVDQLKGLWTGGLNLSPQILGRLKQWVIITSTGASTRIEGSQMTDKEIDKFLRALKGRPPVSRDEQEVAGYADLLGRIFDHWSTILLSENWILQFHGILLQFSQKDQSHKGQYKNFANTVVAKNNNGEEAVLFTPTPPYLVRPEMEAILTWTRAQLETGATHPLLVIANFIFEFLAIHPFQDGNGRLSRALTNLLLLQSGYSYVPYVSLDEVIEQTKPDYYLALRATQKNHKTDQESITPWLTYFLSALVKQAKKAQQLLDNDQPEKILSENQMSVYSVFEDGQARGIAEVLLLLQNPLPRATVKQALSRLVQLRLLDRTGQSRATRYRKIT